MYEIAEITGVRRTSDEAEVNRLLSSGWKVHHVVPNGTKFVYLLVQV